MDARVFVDVRVFVDASVGVNVNELVGRVDADGHGHGSERVGTDDTQHPIVSNIDAVDAAAVDADVGVDVEQDSQYPYPPSHK